MANTQAAVSESSSRVHQVVAGLIGSIVIIAVLIAIFASGSASELQPGKPVPQAHAANALFSGIPQQGFALGSPHAPVTLVEFGDLQCPVCAAFSAQALPKLISGYVRDEKLRIVFRPLDFIGHESLMAARMAGALAEQGKAWQFIDLMFRNQASENSGYVTTTYLKAIADAIPGVNLHAAVKAQDTGKVNAEIARASAEANRLHIVATPGFLLLRTGGASHRFEPSSVLDSASFTRPIAQLLSERSKAARGG